MGRATTTWLPTNTTINATRPAVEAVRVMADADAAIGRQAVGVQHGQEAVDDVDDEEDEHGVEHIRVGGQLQQVADAATHRPAGDRGDDEDGERDPRRARRQRPR